MCQSNQKDTINKGQGHSHVKSQHECSFIVILMLQNQIRKAQNGLNRLVYAAGLQIMSRIVTQKDNKADLITSRLFQREVFSVLQPKCHHKLCTLVPEMEIALLFRYEGNVGVCNNGVCLGLQNANMKKIKRPTVCQTAILLKAPTWYSNV